MQRRMSLAGFQEEADIVSESADRERQLRDQIMDYEIELKELRQKCDRQLNESDNWYGKYTEQQYNVDDLKKTIVTLKAELKEVKLKESQLLNNYDDLEIENLEFQKTILALKTSQVEFESVRHELKRLQEENDIIHAQLEEITRLKRMTEKSLEEALESLQIERDQRHNLRKELDSRTASDSLYFMNNIRNEIKNFSNFDFSNKLSTDNIKIISQGIYLMLFYGLSLII